ncbi:MAG: type III-B CRISPR module RAMP protein Cmr1 [Novibacillus thermophilus]
MDISQLKSASAVKMDVFSLSLLTPLMMHGWQKKVQVPGKRDRSEALEAEVRTMSVKGILRYWWRTLQNEADPERLLSDEMRLFGGTRGEEAKRSPLTLRLEKMLTSQHCARVLPHSSGKKFRSFSVKEGETFNLIVSNLKKDEAYEQKHRGYLTYMLHLAGFGQRARRGAGALQYDGFRWQFPEDVQQSLRNVLTDLNHQDDFSFPDLSSNCLLKRNGPVKARHPVLVTVWIGQAQSNAGDVRTTISEAGHKANGQRDGRQWLGSAKSGRLASPLHATVRKIGHHYVPMISEVSSSHMEKRGYQEARDAFLRHLGVNV